MGGSYWSHATSWHVDPDSALKALQAEFLAQHYDLPTLLPSLLEQARETVAYLKEDGDEYGLLDLYQENVDRLERFCTEPLPDDPQARIVMLREIEAYGGEGIANVLDVESVSTTRKEFGAQSLDELDIETLFGTTHPSRSQADAAVSDISEKLDRGECVCFPIYEKGKPIGWYFIGNTVDS